ncbi:MAG: STAS domain-containing protein [Candidatus Thiodiazotropha sp.]
MPSQVTPDTPSEASIARLDAFHYQVQGAMTFGTTRGLLQQSKSLFGQQPEVEVDLSGVTRADSAGLALILEWMAEAAERDATLVLKGMPEPLQAVARLCQIEELFDKAISTVES